MATEYEDKKKELETINNAYLDIFQDEMVNEGLSAKTLVEHYSNMDFFLNVYLTHYDLYKMEDGPDQVINFFDFFLDSCSWASKNSIKSTAASLKKFYKCMLDNGFIVKKSYKQLCTIIREMLSDWIKELGDKNSNLDVDDDEDEDLNQNDTDSNLVN